MTRVAELLNLAYHGCKESEKPKLFQDVRRWLAEMDSPPETLRRVICNVVHKHCEGIQLHHGINGFEDDLVNALSPLPSVVAPTGDKGARKLTLPELNHLSALLEAERESGSYAGPREQYYARTERLMKWCNEQIRGE